MINDPTIEPTYLCPLCRWDMDEGGFYMWDFSRKKYFCSNCGTNFYAGDVVFDHDIEKYQYVGNDPLFLAANVFWSMRFSSEKDFFEQMASYDISEKTASNALKELISKRIVEKFTSLVRDGDGVIEVALFGSAASDKPNPQDFDLMVFIQDISCIPHISKSVRKTTNIFHAPVAVERNIKNAACKHRKLRRIRNAA